MPAITAGKVLVSGANGFVAVWVVRSLLENGFSVRGAVRSAEKGAHLRQQFSKYGDRFGLAIVPDITKVRAFDDAVKGVDAIAHTASPYHFQADDPAELLEPAIKGTLGILESARKCNSVKRVVVTSSTAAVLHDSPTPKVFSEADWDDQAVEEVEKKGRAASNAHKYRASKTLAERAAWDFVKKHQSEIGWDLSVLNPPLILGPVIHEVSSPDALNTSARQMHGVFTKPDAAASGGGCWVDVRDIALAHVLALQKQEAGGERTIISAGAFKWQDWLDAAPAESKSKYQKGTPGAGKDAVHPVRYDASKSKRILGMQYRSMEETAEAVVDDYEQRGW
ncbi:D-lactaldehyde dehydrogenase [Mycena olivaceomarginata]|nr:D-lactaldehyde dehydrogenase [Mycena olivaceomarginata]KAJ7843639.1 D-lactaldehyde dehydrogenase [Mycena olivaceomarginata]